MSKKPYITIFLPLIFIWWGLILSLFFRSEHNLIGSSVIGPAPFVSSSPQNTTPQTTEPPSTTTQNPDWYISEWWSCVDGIRTRVVECRRDSIRVSDSACTYPKPKTRELYSVSWLTSVSFQEASWPATYQVTLNRPTDSDASIVSVNVVSTPKNTPAINVKHPADGSWQWVPWMTWTTQNIGQNWQSAIIRTDDYAWYGVPGKGNGASRLQHPTLWFLSNSQSVYMIETEVLLSNGCQLSHVFDMQVSFENISDLPKTLFTVQVDTLREVNTNFKPFSSLLNGKKLYKACLNFSDTSLKTQTTIQNSLRWQYKIPVLNEEKHHARQGKWEIGWSEGGFSWIEQVLDEIFVWTEYCSLTTSPEIALENAKIKLANIYQEIHWYFANLDWLINTALSMGVSDVADISNLSSDAPDIINTRCWMEITAKRFAWLTPQKYAWLILEHTYPILCSSDMVQPVSPVDLLREKIPYFRWYIQQNPR